MLDPGILIMEELSTKVAELEELALYSAMRSLIVTITLLIWSAIQRFSSTLQNVLCLPLQWDSS